MPIINKTQGSIIARRVWVAKTFFSRMVGLLGKASLKDEEALIITNCASIHMFGMRFPIDAIFVSRDNRVVGLVENIRPFGVSKIFREASFVIELPTGTIQSSQTKLGDVVEVKD